jgi:hypothetical protein
MTHPANQSNLDQLIRFKELTGQTFRVTPYDLITGIDQKDDGSIVVSVQIHTVEERRTEVILTARRIRLIGFVQSDSGWVESMRLTVDDPDFTGPISIPLFGPGKTPAEWLMSRQRERMAYRVGSSRNPLDNYTRVGAGYTPDRMARYWR